MTASQEDKGFPMTAAVVGREHGESKSLQVKDLLFTHISLAKSSYRAVPIFKGGGQPSRPRRLRATSTPGIAIVIISKGSPVTRQNVDTKMEG